MNRDEDDKLSLAAIADLLDGGEIDAGQDLAPFPASQPPTSRDTDLLFLDVLLERIHRPDRGREARIQKLLAAIDAPGVPAPASSRRRLLVSSFEVAAGLAGIGGAWFLATTLWPETAEGAIAKAMKDARAPRDREYRIIAELSRPSRARIESTIFVRGEGRFVIRHPSPLGELWLGSDGRHCWLAPSAGPVWVGHDAAELDRWIRERELPLPFLQITQILDQLKDRYQLSFTRGQRIPDGPPGEWDFVRGTRRGLMPFKPATISLWANPSSGLAQRLILEWDRPGPFPPLLERMQFDLVADRPLDDHWYEHSAHHDSKRVVVEF